MRSFCPTWTEEQLQLRAEWLHTCDERAVIARAVARDLGIAAHLAGENAFSYGLLYGRDAAEGERLQAKARRIWKKAARRSRWPH